MKPAIKVEGDNLIVETVLEHGVDTDADGIKAAHISGSIKLVLDGSELVDELVKSNEIVAKIKEKLGL